MSIGSSPFQGGGSASIADATESTAGKIRIATTSESTTGTNDTTAMTPAKVKARIDAALVGGIEYKGIFNVTSATPDLSNATKGDLYVVSGSGTLYGKDFNAGDHLLVNDDMGGVITNSKIDKVDNTDQVSSVNALTGAVVLNGANLDGDHSPSNYSATTDKIEKHLEGIDTALGARQPLDAGLTSISGLTTAADKMLYTTGSDTYAVADLTSAGRALLDDADAAAQRTTLGLGTAATSASTDFQPIDAGLTSISGLTTAADKMLYTTGSDTYAVADLTSAGRALLDDADAAAQRTTLGLGTAATSASTDFQPIDAGLTSISGLTTAADKMIYTTGSDTYAVTGLTSAGRALLDDADAAAQRTTLGLAAVAASGAYSDLSGAPTVPTTLNTLTDVSISSVSNGQVISYNSTSGEWENSTPTSGGATDLNGLSDVTITGAAAGNLLERNGAGQFVNVVKSTIDVGDFNDDNTYQPKDAGLTSISGLTTAADKMLYTTGSDTYAVTGLTSAGRAILDDADAAAQRTTLGLGTAATSASTDFQAVDAGLTSISGLTTAADKMIYTTGSDTYAVTGLTSAGRALLDDADAAAQRTTLGLGTAATSASTDFQAVDAGLTSISGLTTAADKMIYTTGSDTYAVTGLTSAGRALLDDADAAAQRTTLGLVIGTDVLSDVVQDTTPQLGGDLDVNGQDISTTSGNANLGLKPHGTGFTELIGNTTGGNNPGAIRFNCEQNTHGVIIKSPLHSDYASGGDYTLTLPTGLPASDKVLQSSSAGVLSWVAQSGGGGSVPDVTNTGSVNSTPYPSSGVLSSNGIEEVYLITPAQNTVVNIPAASTAGTGYKYQIKNLSASYNLTITPASGYIDSSATSTYTTTNQFESITLISDGSNWYII